KRRDSSQTIVAYIDEGRTPESGESLMKFVEHRSKDDESNRSQLGLHKIRLLMLETSINKDGEDEVLGDVAEFPNDTVPEIQFLRRQAVKQKQQDRNNDRRRLSGPERIARQYENNDQSEDERSRVLDDQFIHYD